MPAIIGAERQISELKIGDLIFHQKEITYGHLRSPNF
jgi:hypothetical protein